MKQRLEKDEAFLRELGKRISAIRKERNMSQVELGYHCDMEKSNMNRIESGNTNPTVLMLKKISEALDIELSELLDF